MRSTSTLTNSMILRFLSQWVKQQSLKSAPERRMIRVFKSTTSCLIMLNAHLELLNQTIFNMNMRFREKGNKSSVNVKICPQILARKSRRSWSINCNLKMTLNRNSSQCIITWWVSKKQRLIDIIISRNRGTSLWALKTFRWITMISWQTSQPDQHQENSPLKRRK